MGILCKGENKIIFISEGKRINNEKYGLINYLESRLRNRYNDLDTEGHLDYQEIKELKEAIDKLKTQILIGIKIRSRVQEASLGEIPSSYLMGKLKANNNKKLMSKIIEKMI